MMKWHRRSLCNRRILVLVILAPLFSLIAFESARAQSVLPQHEGTAVATHTFTMHSLLKDADISPGLFAQSTHASGDSALDQDATASPGMLISVRSSYHWWLGFDVNYGYTRFSERYSYQSPESFASVQTNMNQFSAEYLIKGPKWRFGLRPYGEAGVGSIVFSPTSNRLVTHPRSDITLKSTTLTQTRWPGISAAGIEKPLIGNHLGARVEYRDLWYVAPNFHNGLLASSRPTVTQESTATLYFKF